MQKFPLLKSIIIFPVLACILFFLPAGSFHYWEAWIYSLALFIPFLLTVSYLAKYDPGLLTRRLKLQEKEQKQKLIVRISRLPIILGMMIPGLDHRFGWSEVPVILVIIANIMVFLGYFFVYQVFRENSYASRIVEVEKEQTVVTTGPYSIVRHPMYTGMIVMFLFTSFALGSWWAILLFLFLPVILILRIMNEESVLTQELKGYEEYRNKVRYKLIPFIW